MRTVVSVSASTDRAAILAATSKFLAIIYASILPAMDDVDPSTHHG